jgi:hypothetical protein
VKNTKTSKAQYSTYSSKENFYHGATLETIETTLVPITVLQWETTKVVLSVDLMALLMSLCFSAPYNSLSSLKRFEITLGFGKNSVKLINIMWDGVSLQTLKW